MRNFTSLTALALATALQAAAQGAPELPRLDGSDCPAKTDLVCVATSQDMLDPMSQLEAAAATATATPTPTATPWMREVTPAAEGCEIEAPAASTASDGTLSKRTSLKAVTAISDIAGEYVMTYSTLLGSYGDDGGTSVTISVIEDTDSILITNFYASGTEVAAKVDISTLTFTIPCQYLGTSSTYGDYSVAYCLSTGKPDRSAELEGTINSDGSLSISSWWGVFFDSGTYEDYYSDCFYDTEFEAANSTMGYQTYSSSDSTYTTYTFNVIVEQTGANVVKVKNFANFGQTVEIILARDSTATIAKQLVRNQYTYSNWYCYSVVYASDYSGLSSYSSPIYCDQATSTRLISWGAWNMICSKYFYSYITSGWVNIPFDLTYPTASATAFSGDGTEDSPFLIKTLDELIYLADAVNSNEELIYGTSSNVGSAYRGQYFRVENDIDMEGYRFTPIGNSYYYRFGGTFDGNGRTISGLDVNTSSGYAALFGYADTTSTIKNLTLESPVVKTSYYYAAGIAAMSRGTIENCHVNNATITNSGYTGAGGITALGTTLADCSVTNSTITGDGGYAAGVAGQVNSAITNCYSTNTIVYAGGSTSYPSAGVAALLYYASAENCYFAGTVDGSSTSNLLLGGIAGYCYHGSVKKCYNTGNIIGYSSSAAVGGVVGYLAGSLDNCYSTGRVYGYSSYYAGGITGYVTSYTENSETVQSSVTNSYTASTLTASTYLYDVDTERRETIGTIASSTSPTLSNIYYDKQVVNFGSTEYGVTTAELTSASGLTGLDSDVWTFTEGYYPRLTGMDTTETAKFSAAAIILDTYSTLDKVTKNAKLNLLGNTYATYLVGSSFSTSSYYSYIDGDSIILKEDVGTDTLYLICPSVGAKYYFLGVAYVPFEGAGTEDNPYLIKTKSDLIELADITTNIGQYFADTYFLMTNDIDLESDTTFIGICTDGDDAYCKFAGNFNGGGHTIHNMKLPDMFEWTTAPESSGTGYGTPNSSDTRTYQGFIGRLDITGVLRNLTIAADCDFTSRVWAITAPLVGYNYGTIDSCQNYADITGHSCWVGGITGYNLATGVITNCYNAGNVTSGYMDAGGIAGSSYGYIKNCQNAGNIIVKKVSEFVSESRRTLAGGIAGGYSAAKVENCVNLGMVEAYSKAGGIVGNLAAASSSASGSYTNDVVNCINYGTVFVRNQDENVGAIGGVAGTTGELADNYYDGQITLHKANGNGALSNTTAAETSTLISGTALDNYSTDLWDFTAGSYPVLKAFNSDSASQTLRSIIINVASGETVANLMTNVTLSSNCTWSLYDGSVFEISNDTLVVPSSVSAVVTDTLLATCGSYTKIIPIRSTPVLSLEGDGTADSPYLIYTPSDWNTLADYISTCTDDLSGQYVKLVNDIDFSSTTISPISADRLTLFNGDFDGNGKTISGFTKAADASYFGGLFVATGADACLHDFTAQGTVTAAYTYAGGVVGDLSGSISNVTSKVTITSTKSYAAGLVARAYSGASLTNCYNAGTVKSSATYVAGLVAYSETGVRYENCANTGTVTYTGSTAKSYTAGLIALCYPDTIIGCYNEGTISCSGGGAAGLIAIANSASGGDYYYIEDCYNTADISSLYDNSGLIMSFNTSGYTKMHMEGCYNIGDVTTTYTATKSSTYTTGVTNNYSKNSIIRNCWNSGTITSTTPVYCGGVIGYYKGTPTADEPASIVGCYNTGNVVASGNQGGGIIAYATGYTTLDSCWNTGTITGGFGLGGIAGCLATVNSVIQNCWNAGTVTSTTYRAGGIIGYNSTQSTVTNCFNVADITASYGAGGIAGQGAAKFTNVYNTGNITASYRSAGIVGYPVKNTTCIYNSYSSGKVEAGDSCGMIIGIHMAQGNNLWDTGNEVTGTYYLSELELSDRVDTVGTAVTRAQLAALDLGDGWTAGDNYTYPRVTTLADNDYAKAHAAAVIPDVDTDTYTAMTGVFYLGAPDGVTWAADNSVISFNGQMGYFNSDYEGGTITLTATSGEVSVSTELTYGTTVGVNDISADKTREVVSEQFYTISGIQVAEPSTGSKAIYIVRRVYNDGTVETLKEAR